MIANETQPLNTYPAGVGFTKEFSLAKIHSQLGKRFIKRYELITMVSGQGKPRLLGSCIG